VIVRIDIWMRALYAALMTPNHSVRYFDRSTPPHISTLILLAALPASRRFWGYCLATTFSAGAFIAYLGGAPFVGSEVFEMNAIWLGLSFGAVSCGYMLGNYISGRFSVRFGINRMILMGTIVGTSGVACSLFIFYLGFGSAVVFFGFMIIVGLGNGAGHENI